MRIGLDDRLSMRVGGTGVATYTAVLSQALRSLGHQPEVVSDWSLKADRVSPGRASVWRRALNPRPQRAERLDDRSGWIRAGLFRQAQTHFNVYGKLLQVQVEDPPAIMHWGYPLPLTLLGSKNLYTVHDVIPCDQPHLTSISERRHRRLLDRIAASASHIVTVSETSRSDIIRTLGCTPEFVTNTYQATALADAETYDPPARLMRGEYLLVCGSVEPRKNITRLLQAHAMSGSPLPLVIAGPNGWRWRRELQGVSHWGERYVRLPWLDRRQICALIHHARALLTPSLAEGFGLPLVEAMALGTPALIAHDGALAEVAADAALKVDPYDTEAVARAISRLTTDDALCAELSAAGRRRAQMFSTQAYGLRLRSLYDRTASFQTSGR